MKMQRIGLSATLLAVMAVNQAGTIALATSQAPQRQAVTAPEVAPTTVTSRGIEGEKATAEKDGKTFETKTPESIGRVDTEETKKALESIDGLLEESERVVSKEDHDSASETEQNGTKVDIPRDANKPVKIESAGESMEIKLPKVENVKQGEKVANGVVAFASESSFSNAVQANEDGSVRMTTIIDSPDAPTEYEYEVNLPNGGYIEVLEDGSAVVYNEKGELASMVSTPWAKDAEGKDVKTWFTTDGKTLTQHVKHDVAGIVYPVQIGIVVEGD